MFMIRTFDSASFDAIARLLAKPDPADLPRRAHVCRYEGDPNRRQTRLPGIVTAWLQRRHLALDVEEPVAAKTRTVKSRAVEQPVAAATRTVKSRARPMNPGLRVLRRTGTD